MYYKIIFAVNIFQETVCIRWKEQSFFENDKRY